MWVEELLNLLTCRRILNGLWSSTCLSSDARCPSKYLLLLQRLLKLLLLLLRSPLAVSRSSSVKNARIEAVDSAEGGLIQTRLHHRLSLHGQIQSLHGTARIRSCYMRLRVLGRLVAVTQEEAAFSSDWALRQVIYVDRWRLLLPDISDRSSRWCTLISRASIVLPCLVVPELLLFRGVALWALIQIVKNVVHWHVKWLLMLLIILKSSLRVSSSPKQTLSTLMPWVTGSLEHTSTRWIFYEHIVHVGIVSNAFELWASHFRIWSACSALKRIWMINLLEHATTTGFHNLLRSCLWIVLCQLLLWM